MDVRVRLWRKLSAEELMLLNCGVGEDAWTTRRSNQSILREISPECSLEGLMLKLKLQYFGHLVRRADSVEKILMLGKIEGRREGDNKGWDGCMESPTQWTCCCCCIVSVVSDSVQPHRRQPTMVLSLGFSRQEYCSGLPFPPMHACMLSHFSRVRLCATLWTAAHQAPLSAGFSRQEYWSALPFRSLSWTWIWVNSGSWWWTGRPGVLQSLGLPRVGHNWETELSWTEELFAYLDINPLSNEWFANIFCSLRLPF